MAKTRSQTGDILIKKEEDCKDNVLLNGVSNTKNKIAKRKPSRNKNRPLPAQQVRIEEDTDIKSILKSSPKLPKRNYVSQEQVNQLINAIVNDKMSITKAARKVKIAYHTGIHYYNLYKNDPEKKFPPARNRFLHPTREQIKNFIKYINDDKMTITKASAKASMSCSSGYRHYNKCLHHHYTQGQKNGFIGYIFFFFENIGYIVNDKMPIAAASKKASMSRAAGYKYYHNYFNDQNPAPSHITVQNRYTQEQIKQAISHIINDKMSISAVSRKVNMSPECGRIHYQRYLKDNNTEIPVSKFRKRYTQDEINEFIGYIVNDKMSIKAASKKANIKYETGRKYYYQYLKQHNLDIPTFKYGQDSINQLIGYIINDKMTMKAASKKANMSVSSAWKYYRQYLKDHLLDMPTPRFVTQDQIDDMIGYIIDDKLSVTAASKKTNMIHHTALKYYRQYLKDQKGVII